MKTLGILLIGAVMLLPAPAAAQAAAGGLAPPPDPPADGVAMRMLLEKTIFQVDVLTLELWIGPPEARRIEALARDAEPTDAVTDSIAALALESRDAWARIRFERSVGLDRFLAGIRSNIEKAVDARIIDGGTAATIRESLPEWYRFLEGRGTQEGDRMTYRIRGDTLRTVYETAEGDVLLDQVDVGPERRLAVLGSYLARGSDFRRKLTESLFP